MIDLVTDSPMTIAAAATWAGVSQRTIHRWIRDGHNGVKLDVCYFGRRPQTSLQALQSFVRHLTHVRGGGTPSNAPERLYSRPAKKRVRLALDAATRLGLRSPTPATHSSAVTQ